MRTLSTFLKFLVLVVLGYFGPLWFMQSVPLWWIGFPISVLLGLLFNLRWWQLAAAGLLSGALSWGIPHWKYWFMGKQHFFQQLDEVMGLPGNGFGFLVVASTLGALLHFLGMCTGQSLRRFLWPVKRKPRKSHRPNYYFQRP